MIFLIYTLHGWNCRFVFSEPFKWTLEIVENMKTLFLLLLISLVSGDRTVTTNSGPIRGISVPGKKVEAFLGVPYAEPPVGKLRFAKPVPKLPWKDTYDANKLPPTCVQCLGIMPGVPDPDYKMDEDCLYLNLWVPDGGSDTKPIMVFIHGGAFMIGSSNLKDFNGTTLSAHGDVIVVTINYRVGGLGFFSGFIDEAEGSMGMYDQVMAIQWIKDNARHFGGDPENIVLFGQSAGAFSVSLHMVSPLSKNLFKRAILQSGAAFHPIYSDGNEVLLQRSQIVASTLGCAKDNESLKKTPKQVVDCMKRLPAEKFSEADAILMKTSSWLVPRVGNSFLPKNPIALYQESGFKGKDVLVGITSNEGSLFVSSIIRKQLFGDPEKIVFNDISVKAILKSVTSIGGEGSKIFDTYLTHVKAGTGYTYLDSMNDAVGDFLINCCAVFQADCQSKDTSVYFYVFDYRSPSTIFPEWMGVVHGEELPFVFGNLCEKLNEFEEYLNKDVMDKWTAFAKTGNPNVQGETKWPPYTLKDPKYLLISKSRSVGVRPDNYRCEAWKKVFRYGM